MSYRPFYRLCYWCMKVLDLFAYATICIQIVAVTILAVLAAYFAAADYFDFSP